MNIQNKTNAELIQLILDATNELEKRRKQNEEGGNATTQDNETDEGGDRPPETHFP